MWTYAKTLCVLFMSSTSVIVFNQSAGAGDHNQSAKDIDTHFKDPSFI